MVGAEPLDIDLARPIDRDLDDSRIVEKASAGRARDRGNSAGCRRPISAEASFTTYLLQCFGTGSSYMAEKSRSWRTKTKMRSPW